MKTTIKLIILTILSFTFNATLNANGISVTPNAITAGGVVTITPNFNSGYGVITPNVGAVISGNSYTDNPSVTTNYTLTVVSGNTSVTSNNSVLVYPVPVATLNASANIYTPGTAIALTPTFNGGTGAITPNVGAVISGNSYYVTPNGTVTYTLAVTNPLGVTVNASQTVAQTAQPASITLSNLTQTYTGNAINPTVTTTPNGLNSTLVYYPGVTSPNQVGTYLVTATINNPLYYGIANGMLTINPASQTLNVTAPNYITVGVPATLNTTSTTNGTVSYSIVSGNATLNGAVITLNNTNPVIVQAAQNGNANYLYATQNITLNGIAYPTATLTTNAGNITLGGSATLTPNFAYGTAVIDNNIGAITSNNGIVVTPTTNTTYNLTVTNNGGVTANASVTVNVFPAPTTTGEVISTTTVLPGSSITITPNFAGGSATLTGVAGTVLSGRSYTLYPTSSGPVVLTVTNPAGAITTQSFNVSLVNSLPPAKANLYNISARSNVTPNNALTAGFIIQGNTTETVLIRAIGPTLASYNVQGVLATPKLTVYDSSGSALVTNNSWNNNNTLSTTAATVGAFPLNANSNDCAVILSLQPGAYTATVTGLSNSTGNAMLEVYQVSSP